MTHEEGVKIVSPRGSMWHRWDPHIHAPGTILNDGYGGSDPWEGFLTRIEASEPPIRVLGITDYCSIDCYVDTVKHHKAGRMQGVGLIFPNVEFRLSIETKKSVGVNLHLLFSPEDPEHVERICGFLNNLTFRHQDELFRCTRQDLIRLGRLFDDKLVDDRKAHEAGTNQFKVSLEALQDAMKTSAWARANCFVAVSGSSTDGTAGLQGDGGQWAATRQNIERFAQIVFASSQKQVDFFLGKGSADRQELEARWNGRKPCLHGSDAHGTDRVGAPDENRYCWLKGNLTFETLRQAVIEPEGRVHIGEAPPQGALPGNIIRSIHVSDAPWMRPDTLQTNDGMVAIIGARGSGKTALADFIATGAFGAAQRLSDNSFLRRAERFLKKTFIELTWGTGTTTENGVDDVDNESLWDAPHVQYLSQQFVEQLCSSEGLDDALVAEIQRVVFESHAVEERLSANTFDDLLTMRMGEAQAARNRHIHALERASAGINAEMARKDGLDKLVKEKDENEKALKKDRADRAALVPKGQEARAKRLDEVTVAVEEKQRALSAVQLRVSALTGLQADVRKFREVDGPEWLFDTQESRSDAGLSQADWSEFKLDFVGNVDELLKCQLQQAQALQKTLQGVAKPVVAGTPEPDPNVPLIADAAQLSAQPLNLLNGERARLQKLAGIDEQNARRYKVLTEKISRAETLLAKQTTDIGRAQRADETLKTLRAERTEQYRGVFAAIIDEESELRSLYSPLEKRIEAGARAVKKLSFSIRRQVDIAAWAKRGERLLDLRKGPFRGEEQLADAAEAILGNAWRQGTAEDAAAAMHAFLDKYAIKMREQRLQDRPLLEWAKDTADWLYSTDHVSVGYGLRYDGVDIERLSPGTRGIVLLLLYLALDADDDRPLIIDQPEENLDPQSVFEELVPAFCEAKKRRQIIIVTHNANLVVNTDVDQVIVARCGPHRPDQLPEITYQSGGLEDPEIRGAVCSILEGGEHAFKERAKRLRVELPS